MNRDKAAADLAPDRFAPEVQRWWRRCRPSPVPALLVLLAVLAPLVAPPYQLSLLLLAFMYIALACSWNLIGGYAGYFTFGHVAYFGVGAYAAALAITELGMHWLAAAGLAALLAAGLGAVVGYPSLRIKGPAFVIITFAFSQALRITTHVADTWTGGGRGLSLPPVQSLTGVYYAFAAAAFAAVAGTWWIDRSAFGRRLKAIRDDEFAAESIGIDTQADKSKAFILSALLPGFCGGVYAFYLSYINPEEAFSHRLNVSMIVMVLLGGAGTVLGPVIGALLVFFVSELLWAQFPVLHQLAFGIALVALVLFLPDGVLGWLRRRRARRPGRDAGG
ncbi:MAG: branched-chain amino acid ABC transporter permease [Lautropia sp.]